MKYTYKEVMQYINEEDVKFIRLAFCDVFGEQKNISVMPGEMERIFEYGAAIDAEAVAGFGTGLYTDLLLHPDPSTISVLPWRPEHGKVVRMFCDITHPDGRPFENDSRGILKKAEEYAKKQGYTFYFGAEMEFYLFELDEKGYPTKIPYDNAGYLDIAPEDKGENVRREICLTLEKMNIRPESSHHEEGPGQNEIDFRYSDPLSAADNALTFKSVVRTISYKNGLFADFSPKPLKESPGNGFHINISVKSENKKDLLPYVISGIFDNIKDMTLFMNPCKCSYERLGNNKAPKYISWSSQNRSQLIRVPAGIGEYRRVELRSPDPMANPYLAFALLIYASLDGLLNEKMPPMPADNDISKKDALNGYDTLPLSVEEAQTEIKKSGFINSILPEGIIKAYLNKKC